MTATNPAWTVSAVRDALASKKISARELAADFYARIEKRNLELNAYLALSPERAYAQADRIDALLTKGANGDTLPLLAGVPIAVKDVISTAGIRTTCGSKILETYVPPYDATAIDRIGPLRNDLVGRQHFLDTLERHRCLRDGACGAGEILHRLEELGQIGEVDRQRAGGHRTRDDQRGAPPQYDGSAERHHDTDHRRQHGLDLPRLERGFLVSA